MQALWLPRQSLWAPMSLLNWFCGLYSTAALHTSDSYNPSFSSFMGFPELWGAGPSADLLLGFSLHLMSGCGSLRLLRQLLAEASLMKIVENQIFIGQVGNLPARFHHSLCTPGRQNLKGGIATHSRWHLVCVTLRSSVFLRHLFQVWQPLRVNSKTLNLEWNHQLRCHHD